ncbi:hypothetical protein LguiB_000932 [Lonicera macranthoides]
MKEEMKTTEKQPKKESAIIAPMIGMKLEDPLMTLRARLSLYSLTQLLHLVPQSLSSATPPPSSISHLPFGHFRSFVILVYHTEHTRKKVTEGDIGHKRNGVLPSWDSADLASCFHLDTFLSAS